MLSKLCYILPRISNTTQQRTETVVCYNLPSFSVQLAKVRQISVQQVTDVRVRV